jgi:hypothetical protein
MKGDDTFARAIQARVLSENKSREELLAEDAKAVHTHLGVPVNWLNNGKQAFSSLAGVVGADGEETHSYAVPPKQVCGSCKNFNIELGRKEIIKQRFAERLVREEEWKLKHLGVPLDHLGMCDESQGKMVTCSITNADKCPAYRAKR